MKRIVLGSGEKGAGDDVIEEISARLETFSKERSQPFKVKYQSRSQNYAYYTVTGMVFDNDMANNLKRTFPGSSYDGDKNQLTLSIKAQRGRSNSPDGGGIRGGIKTRFDSIYIGFIVRVICIYVLIAKVILPPV